MTLAGFKLFSSRTRCRSLIYKIDKSRTIWIKDSYRRRDNWEHPSPHSQGGSQDTSLSGEKDSENPSLRNMSPGHNFENCYSQGLLLSMNFY